jgi:hypothetical protein
VVADLENPNADDVRYAETIRQAAKRRLGKLE